MSSRSLILATWLHRLLAVLAVSTAAAAPAATMPAVKLKVVDKQSGAALQGVTAMLLQSARGGGNFSGHGGARMVLFATEAISDASGTLQFPRQQFDGPPFFSFLHEEAPTMLLLMPGFAPLALDERYHRDHGFKNGMAWESPGATVAMTPSAPGPQLDRDMAVYLSTRDLLEPSDRCAWQHVPNTLVAEYHILVGGSTLSRLQADDTRHTQAGCASPLEFFKRYGVERASPFGEAARPIRVVKAASQSGASAAAKAAVPAATPAGASTNQR